MMTKCSCLCGAIEFEVEALPDMVFNCHCLRCRKSHGAAFSTQIVANKKTLKFIKGKEFLSEFRVPTAIRTFCAKCGSKLMNYDGGDNGYLSLSVSAIDTSIDIRPIGECFVGEKFDFVTLDNSIPHYARLPQT
jgi:hypothetical protein